MVWVGDPDKEHILEVKESWTYKVEVFDLLKQRVPATFILSLSSILSLG